MAKKPSLASRHQTGLCREPDGSRSPCWRNSLTRNQLCPLGASSCDCATHSGLTLLATLKTGFRSTGHAVSAEVRRWSFDRVSVNRLKISYYTQQTTRRQSAASLQIIPHTQLFINRLFLLKSPIKTFPARGRFGSPNKVWRLERSVGPSERRTQMEAKQAASRRGCHRPDNEPP